MITVELSVGWLLHSYDLLHITMFSLSFLNLYMVFFLFFLQQLTTMFITRCLVFFLACFCLRFSYHHLLKNWSLKWECGWSWLDEHCSFASSTVCIDCGFALFSFYRCHCVPLFVHAERINYWLTDWLVRYAFFVKIQVRYVGTLFEWKISDFSHIAPALCMQRQKTAETDAKCVKSKDGITVRYVVGMVRFKNWTKVRYAGTVRWYGTVQGARYVVRKFWTYRTVLPPLLFCSDPTH